MPEPLRWLTWLQLHLTHRRHIKSARRRLYPGKRMEPEHSKSCHWHVFAKAAANSDGLKSFFFLIKIITCNVFRETGRSRAEEASTTVSFCISITTQLLHFTPQTPPDAASPHTKTGARSPRALRSLSAPPWLSDFGGQHTGSWCGICSTSVIVC